MNSINLPRDSALADHIADDHHHHKKHCKTAVAWSAIIGGAVAATAVSLILLLLGSALGLSAVSPWSRGDSVAAFTVSAAIWLIVMQWIASGLGGYLTGRLRSKWHQLHTEEVFFRDTAHGFLAWAVATILTATVLASTAASIVSGGVHAASRVAAGSAASGPQPMRSESDSFMETNGYSIDSLFRSDSPKATDLKDTRAETVRILATDLKNGGVTDDDKAYLTRVVQARTGVDKDEASARVDAAISQIHDAKEQAKEAAEKARETAMHISLYIFLSLLVGAFIASAAAALGGQHRDEY